MKSKQKTPRQILQNLVDREELNVDPTFSLGISQPSKYENRLYVEKKDKKMDVKKGQKTKSKRSEIASISKRDRVVDSSDDFEDFPPQFQKKGKTDAIVTKRNRLSKNVILLKVNIWDCGVYVTAFTELVSNDQDILNEEIDPDKLQKRFETLLWEYARRKQESNLQSADERQPK